MPESSWRFRPYLGYDWIAGEGQGWANRSLETHELNE